MAGSRLRAHKRLIDLYREAPNGNIALTGEVDFPACAPAPDGTGAVEFVVALAFGGTPAEAGQNARMTLASPFASIEREFVAGWEDFHRNAGLGIRHSGFDGDRGSRNEEGLVLIPRSSIDSNPESRIPTRSPSIA